MRGFQSGNGATWETTLLPPGRCQRPGGKGVVPHVGFVSPMKPPHSYHLFCVMVMGRDNVCFISFIRRRDEGGESGGGEE